MGLTIQEAFNKAKSNKNGAFIPYFILGYPDLETSYEIIKSASEHADIIELGIPFSDPVADGSTIQHGVTHALKNNISLSDIFGITQKLTQEIDTPLIFMMYYNQIYGYGVDNFLSKLKEIGIRGLIIPDLLPDSEPEFNQKASEYGIDIIFLITPNTNQDRIPLILKECRGFLYFVAVIGITGERTSMNLDIVPLVKEIKQKTDLPVSIGFGISNPKHVKSVSEYADGAIVGSAIVKKITENIDNKNLVPVVTEFVRELNSALY